MLFSASKFYCKYVIDILSSNLKKLKPNSKIYQELDDKLFESYLKLEEMLNLEISNF